jgi:hypothetical protein
MNKHNAHIQPKTRFISASQIVFQSQKDKEILLFQIYIPGLSLGDFQIPTLN